MSNNVKPTTASKIWALLTSAERRSIFVLLVLMILGMALETLSVGLVVPAIAMLTQNNYTKNFLALQSILNFLGNPTREGLIVGGMLSLVGVYFIKNLFLGFLAWKQNQFAFSVQVQLSQRLFALYLKQPYTFHLQRNSAELIRNIAGEVSVYTNTGILPGMLLITESLVLLGVCTLLLVYEPLGALAILSVLGLFGIGFHYLTRNRIAHWGQARQHHDGMRIQHLQQGLGGVKDVKLLGRESEFLKQYLWHNTQSARAGNFQQTLQQLPRLWLELLAVGGLAVLVILMVVQSQPMERVLPTLGLFAAAAFRLMPSANRVLTAIQSLRFGLPAINTLYDELCLIPETAVTDSGQSTDLFHDALELSQVTYRYAKPNKPVLNEISLSIKRGESVGFIGPSGAGKSTLVDILLGLLTPSAGQLKVDGQDVRQQIRNWQDQIGYVPQSIFLTDDTLRRNVAFGLSNEQINDDAVWRAIHAAQLDDFVKTLPDGLDTPVGERGVRLSGGQRQRIGIARALYHDPAVVVLDEATSSLDTATEQGVMESVRALQGTKTIIIVAHRLSTVMHCDRLYRMEKGRIVQEDTPEIVLATKS